MDEQYFTSEEASLRGAFYVIEQSYHKIIPGFSPALIVYHSQISENTRQFFAQSDF
ncbi:hypothetical protein [Aliagarivorans marinus]|uniref:hypothetical protein n=1 Tax=Aliagarivorans marinus TaxID=561965 RepID=UPI00042529DC|nr:hypothetical protein [Aliagarivorans marinus]